MQFHQILQTIKLANPKLFSNGSIMTPAENIIRYSMKHGEKISTLFVALYKKNANFGYVYITTPNGNRVDFNPASNFTELLCDVTKAQKLILV